MRVRFCDEQEWGFGWIAPEPDWMERCSHAVSVDGKVWVLDAVVGEGVEERIHALGDPVGVIQLLDRHGRDCATLAERLGVPLHVTPFDGVPQAPFRAVRIARNRLWKEIALWWPEQRVLVCADAVGTGPLFLAPGERLAVHPLLRLVPPQRLGGLEPRHILCGHGEGIHGEDAASALREALATSGRHAPRWLAHVVRAELKRRQAR